MECLFGFKCKDFVLLAVDPTTTNRIIKIDPYSKHTIIEKVHLTFSGEQSDYSRVSLFLKEKALFENKINKIPVTASVISRILQEKVYEGLRSNPLSFCSLVTDGDKLFTVDVYGCLLEEKKVALGYGMYFLYGLLDEGWSEGLGVEEAKVLAYKALKVMKEKFVLNVDELSVKIVRKNSFEEFILKY